MLPVQQAADAVNGSTAGTANSGNTRTQKEVLSGLLSEDLGLLDSTVMFIKI